MAAPWSRYQRIVIETYRASKHGKVSRVHARPVPGEVFSTDMDVECSKDMRSKHEVGTRFRIYAKKTDREGGKPFLYTHFSWPYEVVE